MMLEHELVLSAYLFSIGIYGLIISRNMVRALMCLELLLNAVNINLINFPDFFDNHQLKRNIFSIFVIAIAAVKQLSDWLLFPQFLITENQLVSINLIC